MEFLRSTLLNVRESLEISIRSRMQVPKGSVMYRDVWHKLLKEKLDPSKPLTADQSVRLFFEFTVGRLKTPYDELEYWEAEHKRRSIQFHETRDFDGVNEAYNESVKSFQVFNRFARNMLGRFFGTFQSIKKFRDDVCSVNDEPISHAYLTDDE